MKKKNSFWIFSFFLLGELLILATGCKDDEAASVIATVATASVTDVTKTTISIGGNVTSDGGSAVTARGVCWSTNEEPTIADSKTTDGAGTGIFTSNITGLTRNTKYHIRAYATNGAGTSYGVDLPSTTYSIEDVDGNKYYSVKIGTQEWMKENLRTTKYSDGSEIPNVKEASDWVTLSSGAYCDFDNDSKNVANYGRLYNWYVVFDQRHVCPADWHTPTIDEWEILIDELGGEDIAGGKMKSTGNLQNADGLWNSPNTGATNSSGFTGQPAGTRFDAGDFRDLNNFAHWLASNGATVRLRNNHAMVEEFYFYSTNGTSVRCVKD